MKLNTAERWDEMSDIGLKEKKEIIEQNKIHETDTGSADVQIAILSERINHLIEHLKLHKKDNHSRKGLLILVGRRKRLMNYLKKYNLKRFLTLAKKLKLRI
jgi:small subunit ribosomal protein S15